MRRSADRSARSRDRTSITRCSRRRDSAAPSKGRGSPICKVTGSTEGAPLPRIYARARLGGQLIWATDFEEEVVTTNESGGSGKGGAAQGGGSSVTEYRYYANFAVALCEGVVSRVGRVWADGQEINLSRLTWRLHQGHETQAVDTLIAAREGAGNAPAYRGVAYVVFERFALADYGNRVPQLSFEVVRPTEPIDGQGLKAVVMIPGYGEFVYATEPVQQNFAPGVASAENVHNLQSATDWDAALDQLQAAAPTVTNVSLVVSWFGDDLRAGNCKIRPGVETGAKDTEPQTWSVAGVTRSSAYVVSAIDGRAAYGGTPSDQSVIQAIRDLAQNRGAQVTLTPFILMDVAAGNALPNPYGGASQPVYPCAGASRATPRQARRERSIRRLRRRARYSADWTEYFGHQPPDGSGDVYFHLDPLWSSASIDAIGIDVYWPLADWRDGRGHLDYQAGARSIYDLAYLRANAQAGEGFDWFYASQSARDAQTRTPIADGAYGKPWVFRYKDIKSWWLNAHYNRPGGVESASPTAWVPQSKPFWFMEIGCPAVDKGANQPNVFVDPKSAENALPYYSRGHRDDLMQARYSRALRTAFDTTSSGYVAGLNPVSALTGYRMVSVDKIFVYCWDARPYPSFPNETGVWSDGANWALGHWINGRLESADLADLVRLMMADYGFSSFDASKLNGVVPGYTIDRVMAARDALQPLELAYFFDSIESGGKIAFRHRGASAWPVAINEDGLVETRAEAALSMLTRGQETELPASAKIRFIAADDEYRQGVAEARRLIGASGRVAEADLAIALDDSLAGSIAETWLFEAWAARERAKFVLPPSALALEPGDAVALSIGGRTREVRVTDLTDSGPREIEALGIDFDVYERGGLPTRTPSPSAPVQIGKPAAAFLDIPPFAAGDGELTGYVAALQKPWPGAVAVYSSPVTSGYRFRALCSASAGMGVTLDALSAGPVALFDRKARFRVKMTGGALASCDEATLFGGANMAAIRNAAGVWEVIQYLNAALVAAETYELTGLLRGQLGTDGAIVASVAAGAMFVALDGALARVALDYAELGAALNWRYGPANRDIGDASYAVTQTTFRGAGLRPLSPAHVRGARVGGDLTITWKRRTRVGGDAWDVLEVPLGEENEFYEIDVMSGASVVRTISATAPSSLYTAAHQIADFGSLQAAVTVRVSQVGAVYGRGTACRTNNVIPAFIAGTHRAAHGDVC